MRSSAKTFGPNNRYEVLEKLGTGSLGECYRVRDSNTDELAVVRELADELNMDSDAVVRIQDEIRSQASLDHPHLTPFNSIEGAKSPQLLTRDFVEGEALSEIIARYPSGMPSDVIASLFDRLLVGIASAHDKGVTHLGLAPNNVFAIGDPPAWTVAVTDFGAARIAGHASFASAHKDSAFLAPEQLKEAPEPDYRADIYALGCLLSTMLTGGGAPSQLRGRNGGESAASADVNPALTRVVNVATARDPTRRFANLPAFRIVFRKALVESGVAPPELSTEEEKELVLASKDDHVMLQSNEIELLEIDDDIEFIEVDELKSPVAARKSKKATKRPPIPADARTGQFAAVKSSSAPLPSADSWLTDLSLEKPPWQPTGEHDKVEEPLPPLKAMASATVPTKAENLTPSPPGAPEPAEPPESVESFEEAIEIDLAASSGEVEAAVAASSDERTSNAESAHAPIVPPRKRAITGSVSIALAVLALVLAGALAGFLLGRNSVSGVEVNSAPADGELGNNVGEEVVAEADGDPTPTLEEAPAVKPPVDVALVAPTTPPDSDKALETGPLVFDSELWQLENTWIYHYSRDVPEGAPSFLNLQFYFTRRITEISPHPWGARIVVTDEGGIAAPRSSEYIATASCLLDPRDLEALFCLPPDETSLVERTVADTTVHALETTVLERSIRFAPTLGWIDESEVDRDGQVIQSQLAGFRVGERVGGELDRQTPTCDWSATFSQGSRIGNATRPSGPELEQAQRWGLRRSVYRFDVPLSGELGASRLTAWHDSAKAVYVVTEVPLAVGEIPAEDVATEQVDLALDELKVWSAPDGSAEYVALVFESDDSALVQLLRLTAGGIVETHTLLPPAETQGLSVVLLANDQGCYVQVRNGPRGEQRYANFDLMPEGVQRTAGTLGAEDLPEDGAIE